MYDYWLNGSEYSNRVMKKEAETESPSVKQGNDAGAALLSKESEVAPTVDALMDWMPEARQLAAQCWCDEETKDIEMDTRLAEACARRIAAWMDSAAMFNRGLDFYRGVVSQIGELFGVAAKTSDDGSIQGHVLALKVPELVASLQRKLEEAEAEKLRLRGEIRRAIADWHRFQDFIIGASPEEFFRLTDAGKSVRGKAGVIEKFMEYLSRLWKENRSQRDVIEQMRKALESCERPIADMIRIRDDKTVVWDFHEQCDQNLEPLAGALTELRAALALSSPVPTEATKL